MEIEMEMEKEKEMEMEMEMEGSVRRQGGAGSKNTQKKLRPESRSAFSKV